MKTLKPEYARNDKRGSLIQLPGSKQTNILIIREGETFGGHYHKERTELFYVIFGHLMMNKVRNLFSGDFIQIDPGDMHTFTAIKTTYVVELLSDPYNEKDTWKK